MKKFGFGKKGNEADEEKSRSSLFGSRSKKSDQPAPAHNPYANQDSGSSSGGGNPYAQQQQSNHGGNPYAQGDQKGNGYGGGGGYGGMSDPPPPSYSSSGSGLESGMGRMGLSDRSRQEKTPVPQGGYSGGGYPSGNSYSNQSGYGNDQYGSGRPAQTQRSGGYGGMGGDEDAGRSALFGGARPTQSQQQQPPSNGPGPGRSPGPQGLPSGPRQGGAGAGGTYGGLSDARRDDLFNGAQPGPPGQQQPQSYSYGYGQKPQALPEYDSSRFQRNRGQNGGNMPGAYDDYGASADRDNMNEQDQEQEEINDIKREIKDRKQDGVNRLRNVVAMGIAANETADRTAAMMEEQSQSIYNNERLNVETHVFAQRGGHKTKDLDGAANMFAFRKGSYGKKQERLDNERLEDEKRAKDVIAKSRAEEFKRGQVRQSPFAKKPGAGGGPGSMQDTRRYVVDDSDSDGELDNQTEDLLKQSHGLVTNLKQKAIAMGEVAENDNRVLERTAQQVDRTTDKLDKNIKHLDHIHRYN